MSSSRWLVLAAVCRCSLHIGSSAGTPQLQLARVPCAVWCGIKCTWLPMWHHPQHARTIGGGEGACTQQVAASPKVHHHGGIAFVATFLPAREGELLAVQADLDEPDRRC